MDTVIKSPMPISMPTFPEAGRPSSDTDGVPAEYNKVGMVVEDRLRGRSTSSCRTASRRSRTSSPSSCSRDRTRPTWGTPDRRWTPRSCPARTSSRWKTTRAGPRSTWATIPNTDIPLPWPSEDVEAANDFKHPSQTGGLTTPTDSGVSCSVYNGTNTKYPGDAGKYLGFPNGVPNMQTWIGKDYPAKIASGSSSYVTPGSGLLYQQVDTGKQKEGPLYLVTDTGLRYSVPRGNDGAGKAGSDKEEQGPGAAPPRLQGCASAADPLGLVQAALGRPAAQRPRRAEAAGPVSC